MLLAPAPPVPADWGLGTGGPVRGRPGGGREGGAPDGAHGAGGARVAASHSRRARALRLLHTRAVVLPRAPRAHRPRGSAATPDPSRCRPAALPGRAPARRAAGAVRRPSQLELSTPRRQSARARRRRPDAGPTPVVRDGAALHAGAGAPAAAAAHRTRSPRYRPRRRVPTAARGAQL